MVNGKYLQMALPVLLRKRHRAPRYTTRAAWHKGLMVLFMLQMTVREPFTRSAIKSNSIAINKTAALTKCKAAVCLCSKSSTLFRRFNHEIIL